MIVSTCFWLLFSKKYPKTRKGRKNKKIKLKLFKRSERMEGKKYDEVVCCIGAGYVGGPTMAVLAQHCVNSKFYVVDIDQKRIDAWNSNELPIFEPGLQTIVEQTRNRNLFFSTEVSRCIKEAGIIFIAVNTGTKYYGEGKDHIYDISAFEAVARSIAKEADSDKIVVEKSTVPVGTAKQLKQILDLVAANRAKKQGKEAPKFEIISNPEFLSEGCAMRDLEDPHRVILGSEKTESGLKAAERVAALYGAWIPKEKIITINTFSSELTKLAGNAMLAQRISSINSLSVICQKTVFKKKYSRKSRKDISFLTKNIFSYILKK